MSTRSVDFGTRESWRNVPGAPEGTPTEIANALDAMTQASGETGDKLAIPAPVLRALIVELTVSFSLQAGGGYLPDSLVNLLCWATRVPTAFVTDPDAYLSKLWHGGRPTGAPEALSRAFFIDASHYEKHGSLMRLSTLQRELARVFGKHTPARPTLRKWQADYRSTIETYGARLE